VYRLWRFTPWLTRLILGAATLIFTLIGVKYITDPVRAAASFNISLGSAAAVTSMRVGFGAFPVGFAIIVASCLVSTSRLLLGLYFVVTIIGVATAARVLGIVVDGAAPESVFLLRPEVALLGLSVIGVLLEAGRRRVKAGSPRERALEITQHLILGAHAIRPGPVTGVRGRIQPQRRCGENVVRGCEMFHLSSERPHAAKLAVGRSKAVLIQVWPCRSGAALSRHARYPGRSKSDRSITAALDWRGPAGRRAPSGGRD